MKYHVIPAAVLVIAGVAIAVWLLPNPRVWDDLPLHNRIPVAAIIIGLLALTAALVTILAAVAEVRQIFPDQTVRVSIRLRTFVGPKTYDTEQIVFENPDDSPIINTLRISVRLVRNSEGMSVDNWLLQSSCERTSASEVLRRWSHDHDITSFETHFSEEAEAMVIPRRAAPYRGSWIDSNEAFTYLGNTDGLDWEFERENPWFPGVLVQGPEVTILNGSPDEYRWIVVWWTERKGPVKLVVPFI